jgi:valyl-tRNA synthetase
MLAELPVKSQHLIVVHGMVRPEERVNNVQGVCGVARKGLEQHLSLFDAHQLLHPICPFVTKEIWSQLPGERSTIMLEPFPEENPAWADAQAEQSMQLLMDVISAVRTIRSEADVHPSAKLHVSLICADAAKRELLQAFSGSICAMTRAESVAIAESGAVPDDAAHALVSGVEVVVPLKELIDVDAASWTSWRS